MAETSIEWTERTWNPIVGCSVVSPGCTNCYAMKMAARLDAMGTPRYAGLTKPSKAGPVWTGELRLVEDALTIPLRRRKPTTYFVNSMSDLFHENVPNAWIDRVFAVMALAPQHTFQVLTKRSARMLAYLSSDETSGRLTRALAHGIEGVGSLELRTCNDGLRGFQLPNVWLGVSAEDQRRADERVPDLLATPAAVRFASAEPLLGPIIFTQIEARATGTLAAGDFAYPKRIDALTGWAGHYPGPTIFHPRSHRLARLDWIIVGGESGPNARAMDGDWARSIRDQCEAAETAFLFKQHGAWIDVRDLRRLPGGEGPGFGRFDHCTYDRDTECVRVGKKAAGRLLDGVTHDGFPTPSPAHQPLTEGSAP